MCTALKFNSSRNEVSVNMSKNRKPNNFSLAERFFNLLFALLLVGIGVAGMIQGELNVAPPKSKIGVILYGIPLWLLVASLLTGAAVLLSVVIDQYDRRHNEDWYEHLKRGAILFGLLLLTSSVVSGFLAALAS